MMTWVKKLIPERLKPQLRHAHTTLTSWGRARFCPVCSSYSSRFEPFGIVPRGDARCAHCGALERHRLTWLFFERYTDLFSNPSSKKMLHVAPEPCFEQRLRKIIGRGYLTADLVGEAVDVKMDVTDIQYADATFDVIYCSHVLEHVPDDKKAMREFRRILKNRGWAILLVPITAQHTFEDPTITDPQERLRLFGQDDHVRQYGPDYRDRLSAAGFRVTYIEPRDFLSAQEIKTMGITAAAGEIFCCLKEDLATG